MELRKRGRKWWVRFYSFGQRIEMSTRQEDRTSAEEEAREIVSRYSVRKDELSAALHAVSVIKAFLRSRNLRRQLSARAKRAERAAARLTPPEREMRRLLRQWKAFERSRNGGRTWYPTSPCAVHAVPRVDEQVQ